MTSLPTGGSSPTSSETSLNIAFDHPQPLRKVPCARLDASGGKNCPSQASILCEGCRLVAYCSKECQETHLQDHAIDCNSALNSQDWLPNWVAEGREPVFTTSSGHTTSASAYVNPSIDQPLFEGLYLWGNSPAMDMLNWQENEGASAIVNQDLNLALIASGDLRHFIWTVNALPDDYSGKIDILINDREPLIVARNIALILLFADYGNDNNGLIDADKAALVAETVLHVWSSVYLPTESDTYLAGVISKFLQAVEGTSRYNAELDETDVDVVLGSKSRLKGLLPDAALSCLRDWAKHAPLDSREVADELAAVRLYSGGEDRHHSHYTTLEPSHRVALDEFRKSGVVLPFGASKNDFNVPNRTLFSPSGRWVQDDLANPLDSWDIESVIEVGKAHGAVREDLYGCLYFFLSQTFGKFVERLRRTAFTFRFFSADIQDLGQRILNNPSSSDELPLPHANHLFDRVHGSNVLDDNLAGITGVAQNWGPLLKNNEHSCIMSYFMSWGVTQEGASWETACPDTRIEILGRYIREGKIPKFTHAIPTSRIESSGQLAGYLTSLTAATENSAAFEEYLEKQELQEALKGSGIRRRTDHKVVPYRLGSSVGESISISSLPTVLEDRERWYLNTCVTQWMWSERFIEFCR